MFKHGFRLSAGAAAVLMAWQPCLAAQEQVETASAIDAFHYQTNNEVNAFLPGVTLFSAGASTSPFVSHGANSGVAVIQDRVYYSPAPYSSPGTWLTPASRQQSASYSAVSQSRLGSQGSAGALSYTSKKITPHKLRTSALIEANSESGGRIDFDVNVKNRDYGLLFSVDHSQNDLTKEFRTSADADQQSTQVLFKIDAESLPGARKYQKTEFKYEYSSTEQPDTLVGLTAADWQSDSALGYSATSKDDADAKMHRYQLSHQVNVDSRSKVLTEIYYQSYDYQALRLNEYNGVLISDSQLEQIALFDRTPSTVGVALTGQDQDKALQGVGVQTQMLTKYGAHDISYSARYHKDSTELKLGEQAWQWNSDRSLLDVDGVDQVLDYEDTVTVVTLATETRMHWGASALNLGVAYEQVDTERSATDNAFGVVNQDFSDENWLPKIGYALEFEQWRIAADATMPWVAAGAGNAQGLAQESYHYQISAEYQATSFTTGLSFFVQDFDNMHVNCDAYSNCSPDQIATQYNIENVMAQGAEFNFSGRWHFGDVEVPLTLVYQYDNSEYQQTQCGLNGPVACAVDGERLAWIPEQQIALNIGMVIDAFAIQLNGFYQSERELRLSQTDVREVPDQWRFDIAASYQLAKTQQIYARVENMLDEDLVARQNQSGLLTEQGRVAYLGYQVTF